MNHDELQTMRTREVFCHDCQQFDEWDYHYENGHNCQTAEGISEDILRQVFHG